MILKLYFNILHIIDVDFFYNQLKLIYAYYYFNESTLVLLVLQVSFICGHLKSGPFTPNHSI